MARQRTGTLDAKGTAKMGARRPSASGWDATDVALAVSLIAGVLAMVVAMGPGDHSWLGWAGLLPVLVAIRWPSPSRPMLCGPPWGILPHGFSAYAVAAGVQPSISSPVLLSAVPGQATYPHRLACPPACIRVGSTVAFVTASLPALPTTVRTNACRPTLWAPAPQPTVNRTAATSLRLQLPGLCQTYPRAPPL